MRITVEVPATQGTFEALLEGLVLLNLELMERSALPPLYRAGVRYRRERGTERWQTCEQVFVAEAGDCEDLCAWRVAELRRAGEEGAMCIVRRTGQTLWHVQVLREDGTIEDPSRLLGMGAS